MWLEEHKTSQAIYRIIGSLYPTQINWWLTGIFLTVKLELIFNRFIRPFSKAAFDAGEVMAVVFVSADGGG